MLLLQMSHSRMFGPLLACHHLTQARLVSQPSMASSDCLTPAPQDASREGTGTAIPVSASVLAQRTYFGAVMLAYVGGLGTAFLANAISHLGQPGE